MDADRDRTELATPEYNDVLRVWGAFHPTPVIGRNTCGAEQPGVLVHVERRATDYVWRECTRAEVMNETKRRDNERSRSGQLRVTRGHWIISDRGVSVM